MAFLKFLHLCADEDNIKRWMSILKEGLEENIICYLLLLFDMFYLFIRFQSVQVFALLIKLSIYENLIWKTSKSDLQSYNLYMLLYILFPKMFR